MKSIEWIERAKKAGNLTSDRQIAMALGITSATLSYHRSGRNQTLNDDHCIAIGELCGIDPAIVIADQQAERASPAVRRIYERMGKLVAGSAASLAAVGMTVCQLGISDNPLVQLGKILLNSTAYGTFT